MKPVAPLPVIVVTGFLGSGKTTLLRRLLSERASSDRTAVLINELGEVAIDHHLIAHLEENVVVLANGCLCCGVRDDLGKALRDLVSRRGRGEIGFDRIVIETTGLADPVPILHTLMSDPVVDKLLRLVAVVTTVDAVNGDLHLARQPEAVRQVAAADQIVITKTDLAEADEVAALCERLRVINAGASVSMAAEPDFLPESLFVARQWEIAVLDERLANSGLAHLHCGERDAGAFRHDHAIASYSLVFDTPLEWDGFAVWLTMLLHRHGTDVLRVKGLLDVGGQGPVAVQGVQHLIHPPLHLGSWRDGDRRSRLVFITRGISGKQLHNSLLAFSRAAGRLKGEGVVARRFVPAATEIGGRPVRRRSGLAWMKPAVLAANRSQD